MLPNTRRADSATSTPGRPRRCVLIILVGCLLIAMTQPNPSLAAESVYSTLDPPTDCSLLDKSPTEEGSWIVWRCPGPPGYAVILSEDDLRTSVAYGEAGLVREWESFRSFNSVGDTVEWRRENDGDDGMTPFAAIQRWFVSYDQNETRQILVVSTVAAAGERSCMVGLIDANANPDANRLARQVADTQAPSFRCGRDRPAYHGDRAPEAPLP